MAIWPRRDNWPLLSGRLVCKGMWTSTLLSLELVQTLAQFYCVQRLAMLGTPTFPLWFTGGFCPDGQVWNDLACNVSRDIFACADSLPDSMVSCCRCEIAWHSVLGVP